MQWIYWYDDGTKRYLVGLRNGQGITIGIESDWPTREQAQRRTASLNGAPAAALEVTR